MGSASDAASARSSDEAFMRGLAETARLSPQLVLPRLARRQLRDRYSELIPQAGQAGRSPVAYFHGCAANYFDDGVGNAVIAVLRKHGVEPSYRRNVVPGRRSKNLRHRALAKEGHESISRPWKVR